MEKFDHGSPELARVHAKENNKKYYCHLTGFLEGVAASGYFELGEIEPLVAECAEFVRHIADGDADDIIQDFEADLLGHEVIASCAESRASNIDASCEKSVTNRFFGFCRGVACDGIIRLSEAARIVEIAEKNPTLLGVVGVKQILVSCRDALADGIIDKFESNEICQAISEIVGDSYGDTGIASSFKVATYSETYLSNLDDELIDRTVVLTGTFSTSPRSILEKSLAERGAVIANNVSGATHFIIIGGEPSRDWIEMNRGTKLRKALELRKKSNIPHFVSEAQLRRLMS